MFDLSKEKVSPGLEEFVIEFYEDRIKELSDMIEGLDQKDLASVGVLAHKWRGFSSPYGFQHLEALSISLEKSSRENNLPESTSLINEISNYLDKKGESLGVKSNGRF